MRPREGSGGHWQSAVDEVDEGDQARARMHLVMVHRLRGSEQDVEAAETEFREALPLAISSEDGELLGDVFVQPARLLRDDKG
jgi:hypothetical protein